MSCFHGKLQACVLEFGRRLLGEAGPLRRRGGGQPGRHDGVDLCKRQNAFGGFTWPRDLEPQRREPRGPRSGMDATKLTPLSDALAGDLSPDQLAALEDALPTLLPRNCEERGLTLRRGPRDTAATQRFASR
mgnify:CR=1 FL=1